MTTPEERLRAFGGVIGRLIRKEDISRAEAKECWRQICFEEQPRVQQGAFMAALAAKPETLDEIAGTFDALYEYDTTKVAIEMPEPFIDNAGTGGDTLKTFNISTAAAIVAAACGLYVVRHSSRRSHPTVARSTSSRLSGSMSSARRRSPNRASNGSASAPGTGLYHGCAPGS